jgi:hypothetical protein
LCTTPVVGGTLWNLSCFQLVDFSALASGGAMRDISDAHCLFIERAAASGTSQGKRKMAATVVAAE